MRKKFAYLSWEQAKQLLPPPFDSSVMFDGKQSLHLSSKGNVLFHGSSKKLDQYGTYWWYSIRPKNIEKVNYILLAVDFCGVIFAPVKVFLDYQKKNPVGYVKGGRESVKIYQAGKRYIRKESKCTEEDWTRYFIPYQNEIRIIDKN